MIRDDVVRNLGVDSDGTHVRNTDRFTNCAMQLLSAFVEPIMSGFRRCKLHPTPVYPSRSTTSLSKILRNVLLQRAGRDTMHANKLCSEDSKKMS